MKYTCYKIPNSFFHRNGKAKPQIHMELQEALIPETMMKKNEVRALTLLDFETYYNATVIKAIREDI